MAKPKKVKYIDKVLNCDNVPESCKTYFVALRSNRRVSDKNHVTLAEAQMEKTYWESILFNYPDGTKMSILECKNPKYTS